ncbi:VanZ family protein [Cyclobacterium plantarum]|uniref:VanZ family protein n=1 Tax=Cyclobacterium plantarum TaxID=2716263 RepID=A0ABX0H8I9_9BACT|nr:VanZ family protein [Cyclobacterium plantarum]NHE56536.1 VanZ family protein [Cyclobacterium plantarum]
MKELSKDLNGPNKWTTALFVIYLIALVWILLLKLGVQFSYMENRNTNFIPFNEPIFLTAENMLNALIFVPPGIYTGVLFSRWIFGKKLCFLFLLSLLVEGLQYILRIGAFDVTDLITNTSGGLIGLLVFSGLEMVCQNRFWAQKFINILAVPATALLILILVLLKMNLLPVRYQ